MAGRNILLVGASGGIGRQLAPMFQGDTVIRHGFRHGADLDAGATIQADIRDADQVRRAVDDVLREVGRIDVLINASGLSIGGFAHKTDVESWREVVDTNLVGSFNLVRAVLPGMRDAGFGRIVLISSVVHQRPVAGTSAYAASKAALVGLARTVAVENAGKGVTCNCVALGYFDAGMLHQVPEAQREEIRQAIPLKRFGRVEELHRALRFLIDTEYMTGQVISLNGGLLMA